ncbi:MAG: beta-lactamase family protein [Dehalococcoidia bacterium]|uniref:serine hydrolase domain-containing protein n=1 Tax=Candidatus Amarobacter glycogenicus TaxID=3140699 RepID=UPI003135FE09|nr:beta-lactamase family protein [Dehalococcoidia bacterium]
MAAADFLATCPEDLGIDSEKLEAVFARAKRDVDDGTLKSAQVAVARHGKLAGLRTYGTVQHGGVEREVPATDRTLYTIFSCTKAIVGAATWTVCEDGLLRIEEKVSDIIPEFGTNGKENITVEQVMLHIGGFPLAPMAATEWDNRERRLSRFAQWRLNWEPGSKFEYHATSAHWVLAEIIERKTGKDFRAYVRERILDPMGLDDFYVGLPAAEGGRVADVRHLVPPTPPPGGWGEVTPDAIKTFNRPEVRAVGVPGGGGVGGAAQLAMFYQPLVNGGMTAGGTRVMKAETIEWATKVRTKEHHRDPLFNVPVNRALTVVVAGGDGNTHIRGFGKTTSARAFGHGGAGGQIGWGDPETGISVGYTTDGFVGDVLQGRRGVAISSLAAQVLA